LRRLVGLAQEQGAVTLADLLAGGRPDGRPTAQPPTP
jgi:hypothetical protein